MGRDLNAKCKQCRREGVKLFLKGDRCASSKCALLKRNYFPGIHGLKLGRNNRMSGYGTQLREKQKAKRTYRILEKQFINYFKKAISKTGDTNNFLFQMLELRFDNVVYRASLCSSRDTARQAICHGHFLVNGKKVDIPSYQLQVKDKITLSAKSQKQAMFLDLVEKLKGKQAPDWLVVDPKEAQIVIVDLPDIKKNTPEFDLKHIVEFYSR